MVGVLRAGAPTVPHTAPRRAHLRRRLLFLAMALAVNVVLVLVAPEQFVALGTDAPVLPPY